MRTGKIFLRLLAMAMLLCLVPACARQDGQDGGDGGLGLDLIPYSAEGVTFRVDSGWVQADSTNLFYDQERGWACGLNGVSPLGSCTPQEFYQSLVSYYRDEFTSLEAPDELSEWRSSDDVGCYIADMEGYKGSIFYCTRLVIAPQKNLVLTFCAQAQTVSKDSEAALQEALRAICGDISFETGSQDYITGNIFICGDGSEMCLEPDGSFRWYRTQDDHQNQYYEGVYEVYYGQPAINKIASMTEYGLTAQELEQVISYSMDGYAPGGSSPYDYFSGGEGRKYQVCLDTFYAVILHNQRLVRSPEDISEGGNSVLYLGYFLPELGLADMTNANTGSHHEWNLQQAVQ